MQDDSTKTFVNFNMEARCSAALGPAAIAGASAFPLVSAAASSGMFNGVINDMYQPEVAAMVVVPEDLIVNAAQSVRVPTQPHVLNQSSKGVAALPVQPKAGNQSVHPKGGNQRLAAANPASSNLTATQAPKLPKNYGLAFNAPDFRSADRPLIQPQMEKVTSLSEERLAGPPGSEVTRKEFQFSNRSSGGVGEVVERRDAKSKTKTILSTSRDGKVRSASADQKYQGDGHKVLRQEAAGSVQDDHYSSQFHSSMTVMRAGDPEFHGMEVSGQQAAPPSQEVLDRAQRTDFYKSDLDALDRHSHFQAVDRMFADMRQIGQPKPAAIKSAGQAAQPSGQAAQPSGQAAQPSGQAVHPSRQAAQPSGQAVHPSGQAVQPVARLPVQSAPSRAAQEGEEDGYTFAKNGAAPKGH